MIEILPTLYSKASNGKIKRWLVSAILLEDGTAILRKEHGYADGRQITSDKKIKTGKNIGRSNETTPFEQALSEAKSAFKKKTDIDSRETIEEAQNLKILLPMLAQNYKDHMDKVTFPCYAQPKLNGVRCLGDVKTDVDFKSRKNKSYNSTLQHLVKPLKDMGSNWVADGEIFHPDMTFQEIIRRVKKYRKGQSEKLQFWIYDIIDENKPFTERLDDLMGFFLSTNHETRGNLVFVPTLQIDSHEELKRLHDEYVVNGYEGLIIRSKEGMYKLGKRSFDLLKYKEFFDQEFVIIGGQDGHGTDEGCVTFICQNPKNGETFDVRPRGTVEMRREWFKDLDNIVGKRLTVRYQELSEGLQPIFPVGLAIRDYE